MAKKTPPFPPYPEWTTARFWSFISSALRTASIKWPPAQNFLKKIRRPVEGKRHKWEYPCAVCGGWFQMKEIQRDHIVPVGKLTDYEDLPGVVHRLFCSEDHYQCLCKPCHQKKTNDEQNNT